MSDICSICRDTLEFGNLAVLECLHIHHKQCIERWFRGKQNHRKTCPVCRKRIRSIQTIYNETRPDVEHQGASSSEMRREMPSGNSTSSSREQNSTVREMIESSDDSNETLPRSSRSHMPPAAATIFSVNGARNATPSASSSRSSEIRRELQLSNPPSLSRQQHSRGIEIIEISEDSDQESQSSSHSETSWNIPVISSVSGAENQSPAETQTNEVSRETASSSHGVQVRAVNSQRYSPSDLNQLTGVMFQQRPDGTTNVNLLVRPSGSQLSNDPGPSTRNLGNSQSNMNFTPVHQQTDQQPDSELTRTIERSRMRNPEENCVCPICHFTFRLRNSLRRHISRNHRRELKCSFAACGQTFTTLHRYEMHLKENH